MVFFLRVYDFGDSTDQFDDPVIVDFPLAAHHPFSALAITPYEVVYSYDVSVVFRDTFLSPHNFLHRSPFNSLGEQVGAFTRKQRGNKFSGFQGIRSVSRNSDFAVFGHSKIEIVSITTIYLNKLSITSSDTVSPSSRAPPIHVPSFVVIHLQVCITVIGRFALFRHPPPSFHPSWRARSCTLLQSSAQSLSAVIQDSHLGRL